MHVSTANCFQCKKDTIGIPQSVLLYSNCPQNFHSRDKNLKTDAEQHFYLMPYIPQQLYTVHLIRVVSFKNQFIN